MNRNTTQRILARILTAWGLILPGAGLAGCGPSTEVMEVPEAARKSVLQKKVDDQPRPTKASKLRQGSPRGRPAGP